MPTQPFDFTGKRIRDTYQRVLQISQSDYVLRNGLGDAMPVSISADFFVAGKSYLSDAQLSFGAQPNYILTSVDADGNAAWAPASSSVTASFATSASYAATTSLVISASFTETASFALNPTIDTSSFITNSQTSSMSVLSSSFAETSSFALNSSTIDTSSFVQNFQTSSMTVLSSSFAETASFANNSTTIDTSSFVQNFQTSSMIVLSSSFANTSSLAYLAVTASFFSGSISNAITASYALTASFVVLAETASFFSGSITNAVSASFAETASFVQLARTASFFSGSTINAESASFASTASIAVTASYALTASFVRNALSASLAVSSAFAQNSDLLDGFDSSIFATTGSNSFVGIETITGSLVLGTDTNFMYPSGAEANFVLSTNADGHTHWRSITSLLPATIYYLHGPEVSDIVSGGIVFKVVSGSPSNDNESSSATTIAVGTIGSFIQGWATNPVDPGATFLPPGLWEFATYASISDVGGVSNITASVSATGSSGEYLLFSIPLFTNFVSTNIEQYTTDTVQPQFTISSSTDRLMVKYLASYESGSGSTRTITMFYEGTQHNSHIHTPFATANGIVINATSSSFAETASFVQNAQSASFANSAITSSFAISASFSTTSSFATTASFAQNSTTIDTSSFITNSQTSSMTVLSSSYASTSSVTLATTAGFANNADLLDNKDSTIFATTGSNTFQGNQIISGNVDISGSMSLNLSANSDFVLAERGSTGVLSFQNQISGKEGSAEFFAKDGDTTDYVLFSMYGRGTPTALTNLERMQFGWDIGGFYTARTTQLGSGLQRPFIIDATTSSVNNPTQLYLGTSSFVGIRTTNPRTALDVSGTLNVSLSITASSDGIIIMNSTAPAFTLASGSIRRATFGLATSNTNFFTDALAGDVVIRQENISGSIFMGAGSGHSTLKLSNSAITISGSLTITGSQQGLVLSGGVGDVLQVINPTLNGGTAFTNGLATSAFVRILPFNTTAGAFNPLIGLADAGIIWSTSSANPARGAGSGSLIIGPWTTIAGGAGIKMDSSGNVGIGRTAVTNMLEVAGGASKQTAASWLANSDARIKSNIQTITGALDILSHLRPVKFRYNDDWLTKNPTIDDQYYYNFIAQEYKTVFPDYVYVNNETINTGDPRDCDILSIDSYPAQIISIRAIQEQQEEIKFLKHEIDDLRMEINALKQRK